MWPALLGKLFVKTEAAVGNMGGSPPEPYTSSVLGEQAKPPG